MAHFAKVEDGLVTQVIVADPEVIASGHFGRDWVQTSYNTRGGKHLQGGTPLRKNYASIGFTYDKQRDAFIPPKVYNSWVLNEITCLWDPPVPCPLDGRNYTWDESTISWKEVDDAA